MDNTFGDNGITRTDLGYDDLSIVVIPLASGKIIVSGWVYGVDDMSNIGIVRYNENGSVDSTFGTNGIIITAVSSNSDYCNWGAEQEDGKFILFGQTDQLAEPPFNRNFLVLRYATEDCGAIGINEAKESESLLKFYPNPADNSLSIEHHFGIGAQSISLNILNGMGQIVSSYNVTSEKTTISIEHLNSGIYFLTVSNGIQISTGKLVVE